MFPEPTHDHAFPATHPRRVPGEPRRLRVADLYTRADAITDRLLIEVPRGLVELYRLPWPLAVTSTAWADAIAWPPAAEVARPGTPQRHESVEGRLADVLFLVKTTHEANEATQPGRADHPFTVWRVPASAPTGRAAPLRLTLTIHPGDHAEPVATLAHSPHRPRWWQRHPLALAAITAALMVAPLLLALTIAH
jgi:hypothetical protein